MINVHIVDDHAMVVELLIPIINNSGIARVTRASHKLSECRNILLSECPDVLLLDINLRDGDGFVFCAEIHKRYPQIKIIALTCHDEYSSVIRMLKNGASGYITKCEAVSELIEAIDAVMHNKIYIGQEMEQTIRKTTKEAIFLTPRENEVLLFVAKGMNNPQIAKQMKIKSSTVLSYRKKLNLKLKASNPVELITNARKEGLVE